MYLPLISIIIPVYNSGIFLRECIQSVLDQTYTHWEAIFINDGSSDISLSILQEYAIHDRRIKVLEQTNKGVSAARNKGLRASKGEYITFCDADDILLPEFLEKLYEKITLANADWIFCNAFQFSKDKPLEIRLHFQDEIISISQFRPEFVCRFMQFEFDYATWNKMYRSTLIKQNKLSFNEKMSIWEDLLFNLQYLQFANKTLLISKPLYQYRIHDGSLYSRDRVSFIPQFNMLFNEYIMFIERYRGIYELAVFKKEMFRILYNQFIKDCETYAKKNASNPFKMYFLHKKLLQSFSPGIMNCSDIKKVGWQPLKKWLLSKRMLGLFAFIGTLNILFKSCIINNNKKQN
jgi:glycosyltransferase involved in cell wall biosynthesis